MEETTTTKRVQKLYKPGEIPFETVGKNTRKNPCLCPVIRCKKEKQLNRIGATGKPIYKRFCTRHESIKSKAMNPENYFWNIFVQTRRRRVRAMNKVRIARGLCKIKFEDFVKINRKEYIALWKEENPGKWAQRCAGSSMWSVNRIDNRLPYVHNDKIKNLEIITVRRNRHEYYILDKTEFSFNPHLYDSIDFSFYMAPKPNAAQNNCLPVAPF